MSMLTKVDFDIINGVGGKIYKIAGKDVVDFGWVTPQFRTEQQQLLHNNYVNSLQDFKIIGGWNDDEEMIGLWECAKVANGGKHFITFEQKTGSCLTPGQSVLMADGTEKYIEDVKVGDMVVTHTGKNKQVTRLFNRNYTGNLFTFKLKGFSFPVTLTEDHKIPVIENRNLHKWKPGQLIWKRIDTCKIKQDRVLLGQLPSITNYETIDVVELLGKDNVVIEGNFVRLNKAHLYNGISRYIRVDENFGKLVGLYLSEGDVNQGTTRFSFNSKETNYINKTVQLICTYFGIETKISQVKESCCVVLSNNSTFAAFWKALVSGNVYTKRVPAIIKRSKFSVKVETLLGWLDGDGYWAMHLSGKPSARIQGVSVCANLARDFATISRECGFKTSVSIRKAYKQSKQAYDVYLSGRKIWDHLPDLKEQAVAILTKVTNINVNKTEYGYVRSISSIEKKYVENTKVYCIEVEEDHSFITNGICLKNCVGNGLGQAIWHLSAVEVVRLGDLEQVILPFYLLPYGRSRYHSGMRGRGEGSTGSGAAKAAKEDGILPYNLEGLPQPDISDRGITWGSSNETQWSDGAAIDQKWLQLSRKHLIQSVANIKSSDEAWAALSNWYPLTIASNWGGEMQPKVQSDPPVLLNRKSGTWNHQMCASPYSVITYGNQVKYIKDIKIGDNVIGHDSKLHKVINISTREYKGPLVFIKPYYREAIRVTPEHPILVLRDESDNINIYSELDDNSSLNTISVLNKTKYKTWVKAKDIKLSDLVVSPKIQNFVKDKIPSWIFHRKCQNIPDHLYINNDIAWLIGLYLADGCVIKNHKVIITLGKYEQEKINRAISSWEKLGLVPYVKVEKIKQCVRIIVYSSIVARSFEQWFGKGHNKVIPNWAYNFNLEEIVNGIWAGDGGSINNRKTCYITNRNKNLIYQCFYMLLNLGYTPSINLKPAKKYMKGNKVFNNKEIYTLTWLNIRKNKNIIQCNLDNFIVNRIQNISQSSYDGLVYNLEVENSNSFLINGISTHNCAIGRYKHPKLGKLFYILNSWSVNVHGNCPTGAQPGGFWVSESDMSYIIRQNETFAFSQFQGFPAQKLDKSLFKII